MLLVAVSRLIEDIPECVMSIEIPVKNHQEFPGFIKDLPGKNHGFVVAVCRISACVIR